MQLDAGWVSAYVAILAVLASLIGIWWQLKKQHLFHSAQLVSNLDDRFNSPEWCAKRRYCAQLLAAHASGRAALDLSESFPVLSFFENLALLVRVNAVDGRLVWNKFGWFVVGYHLALTEGRDALAAIRAKEQDPTLWEEFDWLYQFCSDIHRRRLIDVDSPEARAIRINQLIAWETSLLRPCMHTGTLPSDIQSPIAVLNEDTVSVDSTTRRPTTDASTKIRPWSARRGGLARQKR